MIWGTPKALNYFSVELAVIIMSPKLLRFYKQFAGTEKLCLRRCQATLMFKGDYLGAHKDQDSSPDYLATIVFHSARDIPVAFLLRKEGSAISLQLIWLWLIIAVCRIWLLTLKAVSA